MFVPIATGQFCTLSYWLMAVFGHFLAAFLYPLRIAQRLSNSSISEQLSYTLLAKPSGYPTAFESISQQLWAKTWQFLPLFSEGSSLC
jgi:hypothetical protein